jgi:ribosomal-protein-alanine N-acetyltransferase
MHLDTVRIRLLAPEHAETIQRLASDARIAATTRIPHPYPEHGARDFIATQVAAREKGTAWTFAIIDRDELVGACGIEGIGRDEPPELGYWIGTPYWGRGYATLGVKLVLEFAFQNLLLDQVRAHALEHNTASRRVLEKCGFAFLRVVPHYDAALGNLEQMVAQYLIERPRWHT